MRMINDNKNNTVEVQQLRLQRQFFFLKKKRFLHKNKIHNYLNTPKKHNKLHSLGKKCLEKIANKKIINNFLFKNKM